MKYISGFPKLTKEQKIDYVVNEALGNQSKTKDLIKSFWHSDPQEQQVFDEFSENTLTNFYVPYGVVPNVLMNGKVYCVPMAIEESSVVAAAAKSAKYWRSRGGFHTRVISTTKVGQVHMRWFGDSSKLNSFFKKKRKELLLSAGVSIANMEKRGGGINDLQLIDRTDDEPGYYQLFVTFETCDAMGANFINTILETFGRALKNMVANAKEFYGSEKQLEIIMAILSNYTPDCLVESFVECAVDELWDKGYHMDQMNGAEFADKFHLAVRIAKIDVNRATTHNKGIFNGIDAVVIATGNDFRACEAAGHTYAARSGQYRGLTDVIIEDGKFRFSLTVPLALGTVGGLTSLHPLAKLSLDILGGPTATELMSIAATIGLAQNFGALAALTTSGIQKGHMKMHLKNILNHLKASDHQIEEAKEYFSDKVVSFNAVRDYLNA